MLQENLGWDISHCVFGIGIASQRDEGFVNSPIFGFVPLEGRESWVVISDFGVVGGFSCDSVSAVVSVDFPVLEICSFDEVGGGFWAIEGFLGVGGVEVVSTDEIFYAVTSG